MGKMFVFYAPEEKVTPYFDPKDFDFNDMQIGDSREFNGLKFTICKSSFIPDSRNKIGRLGSDIKCILIHKL
jgi:hypothetical protein